MLHGCLSRPAHWRYHGGLADAQPDDTRVTNIIVITRPEDASSEARRIADTLTRELAPRFEVTVDDGTGPAADISPTDIVMPVIGPDWLAITRKLSEAADHDEVGARIAAGLRRGATVIPVRVGPAEAIPGMPTSRDLPEDLRGLALYRARTIARERFEDGERSLLQAIRPPPVAIKADRLPGNSTIKMIGMAGAAIVSTVIFSNLIAYMTVPGWQLPIPRADGQLRPGSVFSGITGEGRIRRAIEAALAKGRPPDEARRCQSQMIEAVDAGTILFATASADLDQRSHLTLDALARIIRNCPDFVIEIGGHTDSAGDPSANQRLSERRAGAVRDYLIAGGVAREMVVAVGHGASQPVAPNDTPANMARNRRIEFNITVR